MIWLFMQNFFLLYFQVYKFLFMFFSIYSINSNRLLTNSFFWKTFTAQLKFSLNFIFLNFYIILDENLRYYLGFSSSLILLRQRSAASYYFKNIVFQNKLQNCTTQNFFLSYSDSKHSRQLYRISFDPILLIFCNWAKLYRKLILNGRQQIMLFSSPITNGALFSILKKKLSPGFDKATIESTDIVNSLSINEGDDNLQLSPLDIFFNKIKLQVKPFINNNSFFYNVDVLDQHSYIFFFHFLNFFCVNNFNNFFGKSLFFFNLYFFNNFFFNFFTQQTGTLFNHDITDYNVILSDIQEKYITSTGYLLNFFKTAFGIINYIRVADIYIVPFSVFFFFKKKILLKNLLRVLIKINIFKVLIFYGITEEKKKYNTKGRL